MHFIAAELSALGHTRMFSFGFSWLSRCRGRDPRLDLGDRSNHIEIVDGVECYLWRTQVHPGNTRNRYLQVLSPLLFEIYRRAVPPLLIQWVRDVETVIVESGIGVLLIENIRQWNPKAQIIYVASDDLETIAVDPYLIRVFHRSAKHLDSAVVPSRRLAAAIPAGPKVFFVPHGVDPTLDQDADPSPYGPGVHAASVGSMLFDPDFFHAAVEAVPDVTFHVIGSGAPKDSLPPSVIVHSEMSFSQTLPYIKHARFGIAPYRCANVPYYLADTSMKLMQYEFFGLPAVCPSFVVGDNHPLRFGYEPQDLSSIRTAISAAFAVKNRQRGTFLNWCGVVERILNPDTFSDTHILSTR